MLTIVGNGTSRIIPESNWWGCNAIYRDGYTPDLLFSIDITMHREIVHSGYYKENKFVVGDMSFIPMEHIDMLRLGHEGQEVIEEIHDDDDLLVIQGDLEIDKYVSFLGGNSKYVDNIVIYKNDIMKNLMSGPSAIAYAFQNGHDEITLTGFDALFTDDVSNVYEGSVNYKPKYEEWMGVKDIQRAQFLALCKEYKDKKIYLKKSIDEIEEIDYTKLSYYESSERWLLGEGYLPHLLKWTKGTPDYDRSNKMTNTIV